VTELETRDAGAFALPGRRGRGSVAFAALAIPALFLAIYLPDAGHGLIADDFRWIVEGRIGTPGDLSRVFTSNVGFYRPLVSFSFAADYAMWGAMARGYGLTNVALCLAGAWALYALAREMRLSAPAALVAAGVWLFNFHAVNMAVLWPSGRTALLVTLFALATALALGRGRPGLAGAACLLALLSKEEAVALPALFTAAHLIDRRRLRDAAPLVPLWVALGVYLALRWYSGAFWAGDAPEFYRFSLAPLALLRNAAEYADRAGTVGAVVALVLVSAAGVRRAAITADEKRVMRFAAIWIPATFALTLALPVRSSLYALLPSVGTALLVGGVASAAQRAAPGRFARAAIALLVAVAVLIPVYRSRNQRWVQVARVSQDALQTLAADTAGTSPGHIVLIDAPTERFNLTSAFGNLLPEALELRLGRGWSGEIVASATAVSRAADFVYRFQAGRLVREPGGRGP
jgi:hypothetical protein